MIAPVVDVAWLAEHPEAVLADLRWHLDGRSGLDAHARGHIPNSVFVDLPTVLAAEPTPDGGRHPLPTPEVFAAGMRAAGISDDSVVVAYDDAGGASAARLVWLLRSRGVDAALLDGGIDAWPGELATGVWTPPAPGEFTARPWDPTGLATIDDAATARHVVDARASERYRGETEPIDPRAGHIPGAISLPFAGNLDADGRFLPPDALAERFRAAGLSQDAEVIVYCGSGVTACHNLIALERAGFGRLRLYPGSWSQYAATERPAAIGDDPGTRPAVHVV